jgi:integrase
MARRRKRDRRARGSGYISPLPSGRAKAHYPKPEGGYFVKRCNSVKEAEEWLAELGKRDAGDYDLTGGQQRLETWLNRWIELEATADPDNPLKEKTLEDYRFKLGYVINLLGSSILAEIKPDHADDALRLIRKNLAASTADQIRNLFWRAMEEAVTRDYITRNPVKRAQRRKRRGRKEVNARETQRLNIKQAAALIAISSDRLEALAWWLFLLLGLREGEVLGIRRANVDLAQATITIDQQYTQLKGKAHKSTTKTKYSDRLLPFPRDLVPSFEALFTTLNKRAERAMRRGTWQEHNLVFPGKSGRPMNPSSIYHMFRRMVPDAKLPTHVNIHHLRHTAAALYTGLSAPDVVRGAIAGHSPKSITDYYGEPDVETLRPWVEKAYQQLTGEVERQRKTGT